MKIAIVDDRTEDRERLEGCIRSYFGDEPSLSIDGFVSAEDFLPSFRPGMYDLVFLDIIMDEMNGIELAKKIRGTDPHMLIVFQTTSREYAFDAFPIHPFDYLIKPCGQDEVDSVLTEASRVLSAGDPEITVNAKGEYRVPVRTICAAVADGRGVELRLAGTQPLKTSETFRSISEKLEAFPQFLLINRGVLINMDQVLAPEGDCMKMKDGTLHPIKVNGRGSVMAAFTQYMISRVERSM